MQFLGYPVLFCRNLCFSCFHSVAFDMKMMKEGLAEAVERALQPMRLTLHTIDSKLPTLKEIDVTPSQASQDESKYRNTVHALKLDDVEKACKITGPSSARNLEWIWGDDTNESESYGAVCAYLETDTSLRAINVGAGQVYGKDVYKRQVYSLRSKAGAQGEDLAHLTTIHGRTDILVFHKRNMTRSDGREALVPNILLVSFAIEIKTAKEMARQSNHNSYEAVIQLLGLNVSNPYASPPVLLTNLMGTNDVYFIKRTSEDPLRYTIVCQPCSTFANAVTYIRTKLLDDTVGYRKSVTKDFGRAPTPRGSSDSDDE